MSIEIPKTPLTFVEEGAVDKTVPTPHLQKGDPNFVPMPEEGEKPRRATASRVIGANPHYAIVDDLVPEKTQVVILNGPPNCGKDTLVRELSKMRKVNHCSFKEPMFDIALAASGISRDDWFDRYNDRNLKEEPWDRLNGMDCRSFMIQISENFIKPLFGKDHFGTLATNQVQEGLNIFTDGGFLEETETIVDEFGQRHVKLIRLHREGCTFEGDSRDYIYDKVVRQTYDVTLETGDIEGSVQKLMDILNK